MKETIKVWVCTAPDNCIPARKCDYKGFSLGVSRFNATQCCGNEREKVFGCCYCLPATLTLEWEPKP
jgi:hypothetical protein